MFSCLIRHASALIYIRRRLLWQPHPLLPSPFTFSFARRRRGNKERRQSKTLNLFTSLSSNTLLRRPQRFCWCMVTLEPFSVDILPLHMKEGAIRDPQQLVWKGHARRGNTLQLHILFPGVRVCACLRLCVSLCICVLCLCELGRQKTGRSSTQVK